MSCRDGCLKITFTGYRASRISNAIDVYVHRLRKQLTEAEATVQIHTIRGVGYMLSEHKNA